MSSWRPRPPVNKVRRSTVRELDADESLFRQGNKASAIFEVEEGRLRLIRYTIDNHPVVLHTARSGEFFAEAALFAGTYHCDAIAAIGSRVRAYSKRELLAAFRSDSDRKRSWPCWPSDRFARLEERSIHSARSACHHLLRGRMVALFAWMEPCWTSPSRWALLTKCCIERFPASKRAAPSRELDQRSSCARGTIYDPNHMQRSMLGLELKSLSFSQRLP
jgi:hypothetical protein